jgi:hypothetical protein
MRAEKVWLSCGWICNVVKGKGGCGAAATWGWSERNSAYGAISEVEYQNWFYQIVQ